MKLIWRTSCSLMPPIGLEAEQVKHRGAKEARIRARLDRVLIWISYPREIRENEYFFQRQRKEGVRCVQPYIRIVVIHDTIASEAHICGWYTVTG